MRPPAGTRSGSPTKDRAPVSARRVSQILGLIGLLALCGAGFGNSNAEVLAPKAPSDSIEAAGDTTATPQRILAYYFHTTRRCASCRKLEAYAQEAILTGFPEALKDGRLVWSVVNVEEKGNEHFMEDYELFTKSVVLVDVSDSTQVRWKNLPKVWELLGDKAGFLRYVQEETRLYLTERE